ncbi:putative bifunctional diguanylate cyclase/phosphodiesterase [Streptomyces radicis]|uniref:EAL domain-containing protein n=1 Tax=Streptomyces radicis TaxID=1750517 RepID=A0A3A9W983_9ACTN|nr:EAL domain-containing protein [Streptomyces radicis]RKN09259.1 EAL domain-containing protein [Streptomyces radicis]RKN23143.1 EAL domain-containing protein [Streptomyces radicis]
MHRSWGHRHFPEGLQARRLSSPFPRLVFAAVCAAYAVGAVLGWGSPFMAEVMGDFGLSAAALLAAGSCLWYAGRRTGAFRAAWALFGLSSVMVALGNGIWGWYEVVLREPVPRLSAADLCFLMFAPLAIIGLLMLAKRPVTRAGWICLALDAWLIAGSLMTLSWSVALAQAAQRQGEVVRAALAVGYPLLDIALVSIILVLHFRRGTTHRPAINAAIGALALTVLCDALFTSPMLREQYSSGRLLDAGWFAGSLLLAAAPWMDRGQEEPPVEESPRAKGGKPGPDEADRPQLAGSLAALTPYLAGAVCMLSILFTIVNGHHVDRVVVFIACAVVLSLLVRQGITLMDNVSLTRELARKENYFRSLVQGSSDVIMIAAPGGRLRYVSPAATGVYGREAERLTGSHLSELIHPDDLGRVEHELRRFLSVSPARETGTRIECRVRHGSGHWLNVESSVKRHEGGLIFNSRDVTERVRLQAQLQHSASHDALTDLPNRALFTERVRLALGGGHGGDPDTAVFFIDLDGFKAVNDSVGHQAGDELLIQAAKRLKESVRSGDTTARLGGDEFAALIVGDPAGDQRPREYRILEIAERVRAALSRPYAVDGRRVRVAASIGIAFAEPGATPAGLMRKADLAMYRAKQSGKGRVELYAPQLQAEAVRRTELAERLGRALRAGEFTLLHQPVVELADGRVAAVCAQARWRSAHGLLTTPLEILRGGRREPHGPLAADPEEERAAEVTGWLIDEALAEAGRRHRKGHTVPVSVRVPSGRLADRALGVGGVEALLSKHGVPPQALMIELPEAESVLASDELRDRLTDLSGLGVGIALGGFGSGGTAAAALHRLPVDLVRLDGELVDGLLDSPPLRKIAAGLLRMAADLGVDSLADGVDQPEQASALRALGCRHGQGLAFSEPLEAARLRRVLDEGRLPVPPEPEQIPVQPPAPARESDRPVTGLDAPTAAESTPSPIAPT